MSFMEIPEPRSFVSSPIFALLHAVAVTGDEEALWERRRPISLHMTHLYTYAGCSLPLCLLPSFTPCLLLSIPPSLPPTSLHPSHPTTHPSSLRRCSHKAEIIRVVIKTRCPELSSHKARFSDEHGTMKSRTACVSRFVQNLVFEAPVHVRALK